MGMENGHPLAVLIRERLQALGRTATVVCRACGVDQGLLSKMLNGKAASVSLETALRLAVGLEVRPEAVFMALGRGDDWGELLRYACAGERAANAAHPIPYDFGG